MATTDVYIPEALGNALLPKKELFNTVTIVTDGFKTTANANLPNEVDKDYFVLNSEHFVNLQMYLKAAAHLPNSSTRFDSTYPKELFNTYTKNDKRDPPIYELMRSTLIDINNHCFSFEQETLSPMVSLAGYIANFADDASSNIKDLNVALAVVTQPDATMDKKEVKGAIESASMILEMLTSSAKETSDKCGVYSKNVSDFKLLTYSDKLALQTVHERTSALLPTEDQLDDTLRAEMTVARNSLNDVAKAQNKAREKKKANEGFRWYYLVPWVGYALAIDDSIDSYSAGKEIAIASGQYEAVYKKANADMQIMISFREKSGLLLKQIKAVHEAIANAESALQHLQSAFSTLETDLAGIAKKLSFAEGYVKKSNPETRVGAIKLLDRAQNTWVKVQRLAKNFQANGLLVEADLKAELEKPDKPPPALEILASTYGGNDVTVYSRILFNDDRDLQIPSVEPGFPEAWEGVKKSMSILLSYDGEKRIFVCGEYSGTHKIKRGPVANSRDSNSEVNAINPFPKPAGAVAQILVVVWGIKEVRDQNVYNYCYDQLKNKKKIEWRNDKMGGDTWSTINKSGVIYYTVDGINVKQIGGKENSEREWKLA